MRPPDDGLRKFRFSEASGNGLRKFRISARERARKFRFSEPPGDGLRKFRFSKALCRGWLEKI